MFQPRREIDARSIFAAVCSSSNREIFRQASRIYNLVADTNFIAAADSICPANKLQVATRPAGEKRRSENPPSSLAQRSRRCRVSAAKFRIIRSSASPYIPAAVIEHYGVVGDDQEKAGISFLFSARRNLHRNLAHTHTYTRTGKPGCAITFGAFPRITWLECTNENTSIVRAEQFRPENQSKLE